MPLTQECMTVIVRAVLSKQHLFFTQFTRSRPLAHTFQASAYIASQGARAKARHMAKAGVKGQRDMACWEAMVVAVGNKSSPMQPTTGCRFVMGQCSDDGLEIAGIQNTKLGGSL